MTDDNREGALSGNAPATTPSAPRPRPPRDRGKAAHQLTQIMVEFGAAGLGHRRMQAGDHIAGRQAGALAAEDFARQALHQIAHMGASDQPLGDRHAQARPAAFSGAVMQGIETSAQNAPESKNG